MAIDLLFVGKHIYTMDPASPRPEAVAVTGDRIVGVGSAEAMAPDIGARTEVVDLGDQSLVPGFYDAHQHQLLVGLARRGIDARVSSIQVLLDRVRAIADRRPSSEWILGGGYNEQETSERRYVTRSELDRVSPRHPVAITRTCGHVLIANSCALSIAGIDRHAEAPPGGQIDRDGTTGEPTGVLRESAMDLVRRYIPPHSDAELSDAIRDAARRNLKMGITSLWEAWLAPREVQIYRQLAAEDLLPVRVTMAQTGAGEDRSSIDVPERFRGPYLSLSAVKLFQDGAIAPRTAALSEPYPGEPDNVGLLQWAQADLNDHVRRIHAAGLQVSVHAIGDAAIESVLVALRTAGASQPSNRRWNRIEHCGLPLPRLQPQLRTHRVAAVVQPAFIHFHGDIYMENLGPERSRWLYPTKTLLQHCDVVAGSSDGPVIPDCNPLLGIKAAMTRETASGATVSPEEAISLGEAWGLFTIGAATAANEEDEKGSISVGKLADLVLLDRDPAACDPSELDEINVNRVLVGGQGVVRRDG